MMISPEMFAKQYKDKKYADLLEIRDQLVEEIEEFEEFEEFDDFDAATSSVSGGPGASEESEKSKEPEFSFAGFTVTEDEEGNKVLEYPDELLVGHGYRRSRADSRLQPRFVGSEPGRLRL